MTAPRDVGGRGRALDRLAATSSRLVAARQEQARHDAFRDVHGLPGGPEAVALWLTWLLDGTGASGARLRMSLRMLDLVAVAEGRTAPSRDRHLRTPLRGLHMEVPLGRAGQRRPLYPEDVHAVLDAIDRDRVQQARDIALLLLADRTGLPGSALVDLRWNQVRLRRDHLVLTNTRARHFSGPVTVVATGGATCPVQALRDLRRQVTPTVGAVFSRRGGPPPGRPAVEEVLALLPERRRTWTAGLGVAGDELLGPAVAHLGRPRPRQLRDTALITIAFTACLTTAEASSLLVGHVLAEPRGLLVSIPGRPTPTAVPRATRARHCPATAWEDWLRRLAEHGLDAPDDPAFPRDPERGGRRRCGQHVRPQQAPGRPLRAGRVPGQAQLHEPPHGLPPHGRTRERPGAPRAPAGRPPAARQRPAARHPGAPRHAQRRRAPRPVAGRRGGPPAPLGTAEAARTRRPRPILHLPAVARRDQRP